MQVNSDVLNNHSVKLIVFAKISLSHRDLFKAVYLKSLDIQKSNIGSVPILKSSG